jgi:hypothetical protein
MPPVLYPARISRLGQCSGDEFQCRNRQSQDCLPATLKDEGWDFLKARSSTWIKTK